MPRVLKPLTETQVKNTKPPASGVLDLSDGAVPGLQLRVTRNGVRSWAFRYQFHDKPRRVTFGEYPALSLEAARDRVRHFRQLVKDGTDPLEVIEAAKRPAPEGPKATTVAQAAARFIRAQRAKGNRSVDEDERLLRNHVVGPADAPSDLGRMDIRYVRRRDLVKLLEDMQAAQDTDGRHLYTAQVNRVRSKLKTFFAWAVSVDEIEDSPAEGIKVKVAERPRERALSIDDLVKVIKAGDALGYPVGSMVRMLAFTAGRREEVTQMLWTELRSVIDGKEEVGRVDGDNPVWIIPGDRTKAKREHRLPLSSAAVAVLEQCPRWKDGDFVFSAKHGKAAYAGWRRAAATLQTKAELAAPWTIHDLRRTVATRLGEDLDVEESVISRILNHSARGRMGVTATYERSRRETVLRNVLDAWGRHLVAKVEGASSENNVVQIRPAGG